MALINQNSIIGVTSITSPSASNVLTFHTNDTTERLRVTPSGVSFSGTNASLDTSGNLTVGGNVNVAGVLTYEDVTSVDAVGLSTFQNGIHVTGGSVGIGTDNPNGVKLHLQDSGSPGIRIVRDNAADYAFNLTASGAFYIYDDTADAHRLQLHSNGKIAFGNYTPTYDLDLLKTASGVGATMRVGATAVSGINTASVIINNGGTGNASLDFKYENAATPRASIYVYRSDQELRFDTAGTERLRITSGGQLRSQATYDGSATTSNTFPCLNLNNLQDSYTANNFIGGITFGKTPGHGNGIRAGMLALYASTGSNAGNVGTQLSFRTSTESGGDGQERLRISSIGQLSLRGTTTAFDGTGGLDALQMYYETDSGQASIGPYSSGGSTYLSFYTNSGGAAATEKLRINSNGRVDVLGSINVDLAVYGKRFVDTLTVDTGIMVGDVTNYAQAVIEVIVSGNPNHFGSGYYRASSTYLVHIGTGWTGSAISTIINPTRVSYGVGGSGNASEVTATFVLYNSGNSTEYSSGAARNANHQLRVKIAGCSTGSSARCFVKVLSTDSLLT